MGLTPQRAGHEAAHEETAEEDVDEQRGQGGNEGPGHLHVPLHDVAAGEVVQSDRYRLCVRIAGDRRREEEIVPDGRELPDGDNHKPREREREKYSGVDAENRSAVYLRRLHELRRHSRIVVAEYEGGDRYSVDDVREDQPPETSIKVYVLQGLNQRYQNALVGDEHSEQQEEEEDV